MSAWLKMVSARRQETGCGSAAILTARNGAEQPQGRRTTFEGAGSHPRPRRGETGQRSGCAAGGVPPVPQREGSEVLKGSQGGAVEAEIARTLPALREEPLWGRRRHRGLALVCWGSRWDESKGWWMFLHKPEMVCGGSRTPVAGGPARFRKAAQCGRHTLPWGQGSGGGRSAPPQPLGALAPAWQNLL